MATDIDADAARAAVSSVPPAGRALACDAGDGEAIRAAIEQAVAGFGKVNVLCNFAGGSTNADGLVTEADETEFWRVIRLDLWGTMVACRHGVPELIRAGGGSVINMTSMAALMAIPNRHFYTAAKGGVASLTRALATDYAPHRIRVNAIAPGITLTARVATGLAESVQVKELAARHLLGPVDPIDIAHQAVYLASEESRVITGQIIQVDSGVTVH